MHPTILQALLKGRSNLDERLIPVAGASRTYTFLLCSHTPFSRPFSSDMACGERDRLKLLCNGFNSTAATPVIRSQMPEWCRSAPPIGDADASLRDEDFQRWLSLGVKLSPAAEARVADQVERDPAAALLQELPRGEAWATAAAQFAGEWTRFDRTAGASWISTLPPGTAERLRVQVAKSGAAAR